MALLLSDNLADGTDISWIWMWILSLSFMKERIRAFHVSGKRAEDMAVRLKYAGIEQDNIKIEHDWNKLIDNYQ